MKIENFDTGLKGQKDIKNLIISPEENYINKKKVREYLNNIVHQGPSKLEDSLNLSLIHISEPTRLLSISYAVFCLKKKTIHY